MSSKIEVFQPDPDLLNWLKARLSGKQIPFSLFNFQPSDKVDWSEYSTKVVAGLPILVLNKLTQAERIILDAIEIVKKRRAKLKNFLKHK